MPRKRRTPSKHHDRIWSMGLDRGFSKEELQRFLGHVENPKHRICFEMMAYLGFRVSEAIRVNLSDLDLDPEKRLIRMWDCKSKTWLRRRMPTEAYQKIRAYVNESMKQIDAHGGYLVYSNSKKVKRYLSDGHVRMAFLKTIKKAGLDDSYAVIPTVEGQKGGRTRTLHRLSTHSLRRFFIGQVYAATKNPLLTQRAARHSSFSSTECYLDCVDKTVEKGIEDAFEGIWRKKPQKEEDLGEFMEFYKMWKKMGE